jgi:dTDP-D-glucose 4,6-dehydratase
VQEVSFIIPMFNHLAQTQAMSASLLATIPAGLAHEIILTDDFSTDGTSDCLYVEDHWRAITRLLGSAKVGEIYDIRGWKEKPNLKIVNNLCAVLDELRPRAEGKGFIEQIIYVKDRLGHAGRHAMDALKRVRDVGQKLQEKFETVIRKPCCGTRSTKNGWRA